MLRLIIWNLEREKGNLNNTIPSWDGCHWKTSAAGGNLSVVGSPATDDHTGYFELPSSSEHLLP